MRGSGFMADNSCAMCGRSFKGARVVEEINGFSYSFDKKECAIIMQKLYSVYGNDFCASIAD
jgi:hypothetical protein